MQVQYMQLRIRLRLVQRLRMGGATFLTYHTISWRARELYKEAHFSTILFPIPNFYFSNLTMQFILFLASFPQYRCTLLVTSFNIL